MVYDATTRAAVLGRLEAGASLRALTIETGISRATLREWRDRRGAYAEKHRCPCPRCAGTLPPLRPYLYVLGQYLGDGSISRMGRSWVLRIATCDDYPLVRAEVVDGIRALVANPVHFVRQQGCVTVG